MAEVPYTGVPQVEPSLPATPGIHPNVGAEAFGLGVAQATARSGAALDAAGNELFHRAYAMQEMDQQADVIHAHAAAADAIGKLQVDFGSLSGRAPKDRYPGFLEDVDKVISSGKENLTSDYARRLYDNETIRLRQYTVESAAKHAASEFKNYQIGTDQALADLHISQVGLHPDNEDVYKRAMDNIDSVSKSLAAPDRKGWSEPERLDWKLTQTSKAVAERVKTYADRGQLTEAQSVLDSASSRGEVDGPTASNADAHIRYRRNEIVPRVEVPELLNGTYDHFGRGKVSAGRLFDAIIGTESGNQYADTAVTHKDGTKDRALGISQILASNLSPWLKEAGMAEMSPEEFLKDKAAQVKLTQFKLAQYQDKYGSANEAARHWRGLAFKDSTNGETEPQYLKRFNKNLAKSADREELGRVADARAEELAPGDVNFREHFGSKALTEHSAMITAEKQKYQQDKFTVQQALMPDAKTGKAPTSPDQIQDSAFHEIWDNNPRIRAEFQKTFERNAKADYVPTDSNQAEFRRWYGKMRGSMATDADREEALKQNFMNMEMPWENRQKLIDAQQSLFKNAPRNPAMSHAMQVLQPMLFEAGLTKKENEEDYNQLVGTMHLLLEQRLEKDKQLPKDEEIRTIGAGLIRDQVLSSGAFGNKTEKAFKVTPDEKWKNLIIQRYQETHDGAEPSPGMIQQIWAAESYNWFYGKKKPESDKVTGGATGLRSAAK